MLLLACLFNKYVQNHVIISITDGEKKKKRCILSALMMNDDDEDKKFPHMVAQSHVHQSHPR